MTLGSAPIYVERPAYITGAPRNPTKHCSAATVLSSSRRASRVRVQRQTHALQHPVGRVLLRVEVRFDWTTCGWGVWWARGARSARATPPASETRPRRRGPDAPGVGEGRVPASARATPPVSETRSRRRGPDGVRSTPRRTQIRVVVARDDPDHADGVHPGRQRV